MNILSISKILPRYIFTGICSTSIYFLTFQILLSLNCCSLYLVTTIAFCSGVIINFTLHRHVTYRATNQALSTGIYRYSILLVFNYAITIITMYIITTVLRYSPQLGWLIGSVLTSLLGFVIGRHWVFNVRQINS